MKKQTANMVDGLGYEEVLERYYTVRYAWKYIIPNEKKSNELTGKSGITNADVLEAMHASAPTRGKQFSQLPLWGFESDRVYLPEGIEEEQANKIVLIMDRSFKDQMDKAKWTIRTKTSNTDKGTEFYRGPEAIWLEFVKKNWDIAYAEALQSVLKMKVHAEERSSKSISYRGSQPRLLKMLELGLEHSSKVRGNFATGIGKGLLSFALPFETKQGSKSKIVINYCHNIATTKQLCSKHIQYSNEFDKYKNSFNSLVVCSDTNVNAREYKEGVRVISSSDEALIPYIENALRSKRRTFFYINVDSAGNFNRVYNTIAKKLKYTENAFKIIDEIQNFTGHISSKKCQVFAEPIKGYQVGLTATENRRGEGNENRHLIYNDDIEYFGPLASNYTQMEAVLEGLNCPIHFKIYGINEFTNPILHQIANEYTEVDFGKGRFAMRGKLVRLTATLVVAINEDNRTHILITAHLHVDVEHAIKLIDLYQQLGIIPKKFKVFRALPKDGKEAIADFNNSKFGICIGSPWLITGIDAPTIDALMTIHTIGNVILSSQFIGRGVRRYEDKECYVYITYDVNEQGAVPPMLEVAHNILIHDTLSHRGMTNNEDPAPRREILGSRIQRNITFSEQRDEAQEVQMQVSWDNFWEDFTQTENLSFKTFTKKSSEVLLGLAKQEKSFFTFVEKYSKEFKLIHFSRGLSDKAFSHMRDYKKIPEKREEIERYVKNNSKYLITLDHNNPLIELLKVKLSLAFEKN